MNPSHLKYHSNKYKYAKMYYTIIKRYLSVSADIDMSEPEEEIFLNA